MRTFAALLAAAALAPSAPALAGAIFNATNLAGGSRWDAAPRTIGGLERSLQGGLRYSVQGGSLQAYRDQFAWAGGSPPTVPAFTTAVQQAFDAWASVDPASGLGSQLSFVPNLSTPVVGANTGNGGVAFQGAEIDLFASTDAGFWNVGNSNTQAETFFSGVNSTVRLTSGTPNYAGSFAISGADITFNNNPGAVYTLDFFRRLLTHEIGHAIGLGDVEGDLSPNRFIDDNYDGSTAATTVATLNNSWAALVDPLNPAASPLGVYTVPFANPGTTTPGVDILMESRGLGIGATNPVAGLVPLTNDDYGTRQFLYPVVPEPAAAVTAAALLGLARRRRR